MRSELDRGLREEYVWHGAGTREGEGSGRVQGPGMMQEPGEMSRGVGGDHLEGAWDGAGAYGARDWVGAWKESGCVRGQLNMILVWCLGD